MTVLCWSTVATAFKLSLAHLDPIRLLLYACLTSILVLGAIAWRQGHLGRIAGLTPAEWRYSALAGLFNPFLYYLVLFSAYDRLPAQMAQPINYTWAITLTLLSILVLRQQVRASDLTASLICYSGVLLISTGGQASLPAPEQLGGVGLALLSTLLWAGYWIFNVRDRREPVVGLLANFLCSLPWILVADLLVPSLKPVTLTGLLGAAYVGAVEMGIAFFFWSRALKLASNTSRISNLIFLSPFLSLWLIHHLVGEPILPSTWGGLACILGGLALQRLGSRQG